MSSHLAISYSPNPAASKSSAAGQAASTPTDGLGFLGALIDQLLAGDAGTAVGQMSSALTSAPDATAATPRTSTGDDAAAHVSDGLKLLKRLASELRGLQFQLSAGENPDSDELKMLDNTLDRLSKILGFSLTAVAAPNSTPTTDNPSGDIPSPVPATDPNTVIASLAAVRTGIYPSADPSADDAAVAPATTGTVQAAFANLTKELDAASAAVTALSPALAQKLEAFANQLGAVQANPQALAALAGAADDPAAAISTALAKLATPPHLFSEFTPLMQLAGETQLQTPAIGAPSSPRPIGSDRAKRSNTESLTIATRALETNTPALAATVKPRASDRDTTAEARVIAADAPDPEPAKAATSSTSQATPDAASGAAPVLPQARALPAPYQPVANPINMGQVAFEMVHQVQKGLSRFSIRLDPAELGRIDVRMSVDHSGAVTARLTVDRAETLDLFQRDRTVLERALAGAGLDAGKTNLEFSLRQNPFAGGGGNRQSPGTFTADSSSTVASDSSDLVHAVHSITLYRGAATSRGVNILA